MNMNIKAACCSSVGVVYSCSSVCRVMRTTTPRSSQDFAPLMANATADQSFFLKVELGLQTEMFAPRVLHV